MTTQTVSINKIITAVVFVSAALIASLFVFHMSHKEPKPTLSADNGIIFTVARDIKPFSLVNANGSDFTEKDFYQHWTLLFFGFTHCASICPTTLDMMNRAYAKLHSTYPNLQVVLISLDPDRDSPAELSKYIQSFNPAFIAASGRLSAIRKLQSDLGIYSARDESSPANNYQLQHTSSILLINPHGQWAGLFNFGMSPEQFTIAVNTGVQSSLEKMALKS